MKKPDYYFADYRPDDLLNRIAVEIDKCPSDPMLQHILMLAAAQVNFAKSRIAENDPPKRRSK